MHLYMQSLKFCENSMSLDALKQNPHRLTPSHTGTERSWRVT
jgi:hypothetical protein